jgi:polyisoprenoid-binding protein YceI
MTRSEDPKEKLTMKTLKLATLILFTVLLVPTAMFADATTWQVDPAHTNVTFEVRHLLTQVPGRFNDFTGTIRHDPENPGSSSVEFTVQAKSIDTRNDRRDNHLRSADFFDVEKFPTLTFKSKKVEGSGNELQVTGDLTIHGVTREVTIPVTFLGSMETPMGPRAGFSTEFALDRKEYGITWNKVLDQGGALLGDEVSIEIDVEATRPQEEQAAAAE